MKTDIWMPLYWGDLLADTLHLSRADFGSYVLLIGAYWRNGGPLPDDDDALCRVTRCHLNEWARTKPILACFFSVTDGVWRHKRVDLELSIAVQNKDKNVKRTELARKSLESKRRGTVTSTVTDIVTMSPSPSPSPSPVPKVQTNNGYPSLDEVKTVANMVGMPEADAVEFWNHFESSGWVDKNGNPVVSWRAKMANWKTTARASSLESDHRSRRPLSTLELKTIIEAKKCRAAEIRTKYCSDAAMGSHWADDSKKTEYFTLKREAKDLQEQLSNMA